jgi:hypothetical protein
MGSLTGLTVLCVRGVCCCRCFCSDNHYRSLHTNQLRGTLPATLGSLTSLQILSLKDNQLRGVVPAAMGNLTLVTLCAESGLIRRGADASRRELAQSGLCGAVPMTHPPDDGPLPSC